MGQDEWFDEDEDQFEIPSIDNNKGKKPKRQRPVVDDWDEGNEWNDWDDDLPGRAH
ncbi:MAG TPA: hypothetical protein VNH42_02255 [Mariprofundaceae bacterium]|nr:hypothetical protein [Mariprofundaceae bacterium]